MQAHKIVCVCLGIILLGCRVPDPPVISQKNRGLIYDTAMEAEIRSGTAPVIVTTAVSRYVDTLAEPVAITEWTDKTCRWEVFVATNRGAFDDTDEADETIATTIENRVLDVPRYGRADVLLPRKQRGTEPKMKQSPAPLRMLPFVGRRKSPDDEMTAAADARELTETDFLHGINDQLTRSRQQDLLLFVHGFNVSFDAAIVRTAQIALDMPFNGAVVAYCWPSQCGVLNYEADEPINKASVSPFTQFLKTMLAGVPKETRINIVVHSMGNRIVMEALHNLPAPRGGNSANKSFANVVLCAPDVGRNDFLDWAPGVVAQSDRVTLYANSSDTALIASKSLHSEMRAGDAWVPLVVEGIETIDCSRIDLSLMGHSYYGSNTDVLSDLFMLIKEDHPASKRPHLTKKKSATGPYWQFAQSAPAILCTWHFDE